MKSSNIGGQAVLEGIMMRNGGRYSVAVRKPDGDIEVDIRQYKSIIPWKTPLKIPFIRGIFNFVDSLVLGMKTLTFSANFFEEEEEELLTEAEVKKRERNEKIMMNLTVVLSVIIIHGASLLFKWAGKALYRFKNGHDCLRRTDPCRIIPTIYCTDLTDEGYSENVYVSWSRA